jgi:putative sigma-54 modulation protein
MQENETPYNISVTFRHTDSTDALKSYATDKVAQSLKKYVHQPADVRVILSVEKRDHTAEVIINSKGYDFTSSATQEDLYAAIDKMIDAMSKQLRRQKEKNVDRHKQGSGVDPMA